MYVECEKKPPPEELNSRGFSTSLVSLSITRMAYPLSGSILVRRTCREHPYNPGNNCRPRVCCRPKQRDQTGTGVLCPPRYRGSPVSANSSDAIRKRDDWTSKHDNKFEMVMIDKKPKNLWICCSYKPVKANGACD